jgi:hypothetical protein
MKSKVSKTTKVSKTKKQELVDAAVFALNEANYKMGYDVISRETLQKIMDEYIKRYDSPSKPGDFTITLSKT